MLYANYHSIKLGGKTILHPHLATNYISDLISLGLGYSSQNKLNLKISNTVQFHSTSINVFNYNVIGNTYKANDFGHVI